MTTRFSGNKNTAFSAHFLSYVRHLACKYCTTADVGGLEFERYQTDSKLICSLNMSAVSGYFNFLRLTI